MNWALARVVESEDSLRCVEWLWLQVDTEKCKFCRVSRASVSSLTAQNRP